jgi:hypothetical protein
MLTGTNDNPQIDLQSDQLIRSSFGSNVVQLAAPGHQLPTTSFNNTHLERYVTRS